MTVATATRCPSVSRASSRSAISSTQVTSRTRAGASKASMLTLTGARAIVVDATTETTGELHLVDAVVSASPAQDAERLDVDGCVVTPGLVNAHHHLLQTAFRTLPGTRGVPMSTWLPTMAAAYAEVGVDGELSHVAAAAGLAEALLSGVTTVADHHLTWPSDAETSLEIALGTVRAAERLGARLVFVRGSARDDPEAAAISASLIAESIEQSDLLQLAVGPAGVHSDAPETFRLLAEVAQRYGLRRRTQANEQVDVAIAL